MQPDNDKTVSFDGNVRYFKGVIPNTEYLFEELQKLEWQEIGWGPTQRKLPRLCFGDVGQTPIGGLIQSWLVEFFRYTMSVYCEVTSIFGNNYRNGNDYLPDHRDEYNDGEVDLHVVSLSFGVSRLFRFRNTNVVTPKFDLSDGDLFIFSPKMNRDYKHGIPKQSQIIGQRINLTCFCKFAGDPYTTPFAKSEIPSLPFAQIDPASVVPIGDQWRDVIENMTDDEIAMSMALFATHEK